MHMQGHRAAEAAFIVMSSDSEQEDDQRRRSDDECSLGHWWQGDEIDFENLMRTECDDESLATGRAMTLGWAPGIQSFRRLRDQASKS